MEFWKPLQKELEAAGDANIAAQQRAYMRGKFDFYGCKAPTFQKPFSEFYKEYKATTWEELKEHVLWTWDQPQREWQLIGELYLRRSKKLWGHDMISFCETLITTKSWWDTVDMISTNDVGKYLENKPEFASDQMKKWNLSSDIWKIRTSIIFQLKYKENVNTEFLSEAILRHKGSDEFFINKASGWALRQYSKFNQEWVKEFISSNELSTLTVREGSKYLTD